MNPPALRIKPTAQLFTALVFLRVLPIAGAVMFFRRLRRLHRAVGRVVYARRNDVELFAAASIH